MYDTIQVLIPRANLSAIEAHDALEAEAISIYSKQKDFDTGKLSYFRFKAEALKNLMGTYSNNGLSIRGSLPKFYSNENDNVNSLTIEQTKLGLEELEWVLGLPLLQYGFVKRLDVAFTFAVQAPEAHYLNAMQGYDKGKFNHIGTKAAPETKRYDFGSNLSLNCYNKRLEADFIPPNFAGKNLLRIEMQIKGGIQYLPVSELWEPAIYEKYIAQYCTLFHKMKFKENTQTLQPLAGITPKQLQDFDTYLLNVLQPERIGTLELSRKQKHDYLKAIVRGKGYAIQTNTAPNLRSELASLITPEKLLEQVTAPLLAIE